MHKPEYKCCGQTFNTKESLEEHKEEMHKQPLTMWSSIIGELVNFG